MVECFQDGLTALAIAAKEGFVEIAHDLIAKGAYVNVVDRVSCIMLQSSTWPLVRRPETSEISMDYLALMNP